MISRVLESSWGGPPERHPPNFRPRSQFNSRGKFVGPQPPYLPALHSNPHTCHLPHSRQPLYSLAPPHDSPSSLTARSHLSSSFAPFLSLSFSLPHHPPTSHPSPRSPRVPIRCRLCFSSAASPLMTWTLAHGACLVRTLSMLWARAERLLGTFGLRFQTAAPWGLPPQTCTLFCNAFC